MRCREGYRFDQYDEQEFFLGNMLLNSLRKSKEMLASSKA